VQQKPHTTTNLEKNALWMQIMRMRVRVSVFKRTLKYKRLDLGLKFNEKKGKSALSTYIGRVPPLFEHFTIMALTEAQEFRFQPNQLAR
jgi:hypothetical protein